MFLHKGEIKYCIVFSKESWKSLQKVTMFDSAHVVQIACNTHSIVLNFVCTVNTSVHRHDSIAWGY